MENTSFKTLSDEKLEDLTYELRDQGRACFDDGDTEGALRLFRQSLAAGWALWDRGVRTVDCTRTICYAEDAIGNALRLTGDTDKAMEALNISLKIRRLNVADHPDSPLCLVELADTLYEAALTLRDANDPQGALALLGELEEHSQKLAALAPDDPDALLTRTQGLMKQGEILRAQKKDAEALRKFTDALRFCKQLTALAPEDLPDRFLMVSILLDISETMESLGYKAEAEKPWRTMLRISRELSSADPADIEYLNALATAAERLGDLVLARGGTAAALPFFVEAVSARRQLSALDREWSTYYARLLDKVVPLLREAGDTDKALTLAMESCDQWEALLSQDSSSQVRPKLAAACERCGDLLKDSGVLPRALAQYHRSSVLRQIEAESAPQDALLNARYFDVMIKYWSCMNALDLPMAGSDREAVVRDCLTTLRRAIQSYPKYKTNMWTLANAYASTFFQVHKGDGILCFDKAIGDISSIVQADPCAEWVPVFLTGVCQHIHESRSLRVNTYVLDRVLKDCIRQLERSLRADPKDPILLESLAWMTYLRSLWNKDNSLLRKAAQIAEKAPKRRLCVFIFMNTP